MKDPVRIPDAEYAERVRRAAKLAADRGLDVLLVHSNEADFANVRYFSGFWPLFETAGVAISSRGEAALIVGPESSAYGADVSRIGRVFSLAEYRESADPSYPELKPATYPDVFRAIGAHGPRPRIGIGGYLVTTVVQMEGLRAAYPRAEIVRADDIMIELRSRKSPAELACLEEGFRITETALEAVIGALRPGVTELEMVGVAQRAIYENGAEYEGLPMYVFSEKSSRHAISRPTHRRIGAGDIVQLNISARVDGYSPSIGIPVSMGRLQGRKREVVEFGLEAHRWTQARLKAGAVASGIARDYLQLFKSRGQGEHYLYGPCHGLGMIEVEPPWMETNSTYPLQENMTFQIDTFVSTPEFGIRWETGAAVTADGCRLLSRPLGTIHEIA
jgi:Xaa-Pro aminopeptidase